MPDYTSRLGFEEQDTGSNNATWGQRLNDNVFELIDEALAGVEAITVSSAVTLSNDNALTNQARQPVHLLSGDGGFAVTVPNKENWWLVKNGCTADVTYTAGATAATIRAGTMVHVYCDGTNVYSNDPTLDQIKAAAASLDLGSARESVGEGKRVVVRGGLAGGAVLETTSKTDYPY